MHDASCLTIVHPFPGRIPASVFLFPSFFLPPCFRPSFLLPSCFRYRQVLVSWTLSYQVYTPWTTLCYHHAMPAVSSSASRSFVLTELGLPESVICAMVSIIASLCLGEHPEGRLVLHLHLFSEQKKLSVCSANDAFAIFPSCSMLLLLGSGLHRKPRIALAFTYHGIQARFNTEGFAFWGTPRPADLSHFATAITLILRDLCTLPTTKSRFWCRCCRDYCSMLRERDKHGSRYGCLSADADPSQGGHLVAQN